MYGQGGGRAGAGWASDVPTIKQATTVPMAVEGSLLILGSQCLLRLQKKCRLLLTAAYMTAPIQPTHLEHQCVTHHVLKLPAQMRSSRIAHDIVARQLSYCSLKHFHAAHDDHHHQLWVCKHARVIHISHTCVSLANRSYKRLRCCLTTRRTTNAA